MGVNFWRHSFSMCGGRRFRSPALRRFARPRNDKFPFCRGALVARHRGSSCAVQPAHPLAGRGQALVDVGRFSGRPIFGALPVASAKVMGFRPWGRSGLALAQNWGAGPRSFAGNCIEFPTMEPERAPGVSPRGRDHPISPTGCWAVLAEIGSRELSDCAGDFRSGGLRAARMELRPAVLGDRSANSS